MDDLRVLVLFYMVEGALVGFVGLGLIGVRLIPYQMLKVGVLQGLLVYLVRSLYMIYNIPLGTHTLVNLIGLIVILFLVIRKGWGIAAIGGIIGFIIVIISEAVATPFLLNYTAMTLEDSLRNVWIHIGLGYCAEWLLILIAIFLAITKKAIIELDKI